MQNIYSQFSTIVIRTPNYTLTKFKKLVADQITLEQFCSSKDFQEALYIASPELYVEMQKWLTGKSKEGKELEKLKHSLYRYLARMSTRSTPFGLFAGITVADISGTKTKYNNTNKGHRVTRPDMNFACALGQFLSKQKEIRTQLKFYPNNSIYLAGNKFRYVEYSYGEKSKRIHKLSAVDKNPYLEKILGLAKNGSLIEPLTQSIIEAEISFEEAHEFVLELIESQLLLSELEPSTTEADYWSFLINKLKTINNTEKYLKALVLVKSALNELDQQPSGIVVEDYYEKIKSILNLFDIGYEQKYLFQTDMLLNDAYTGIDTSIANEVLEGIRILNKLSITPKETAISNFASEFHKRYEEREIPFLTVLDPETGLGYPANRAVETDVSPLIDGLVLPSGINTDSKINWNAIQSFLLKKYQGSLKNSDYSVELTDKELESFNSNYDDLPNTFSAMVQLLPPNIPTEENSILFNSVGGNSALCLIGRFCHTNEELYDHAKQIAQKEKELALNSIVAEVVHLPEARAGNILMHPKFYEYELPYLAAPSVDNDHALELSDLMVSVREKGIFIRSKKLNKYIVPRLSNAHNFSYDALPAYRFLCDMQLQGKRSGVGFSWGAFANEYPFLPRVTYKNLIFSLATWNVSKNDFAQLVKIKNDKELLNAIRKWCKKNKIPQWVTLVDGDNELAIDMTCLLSVKTLFRLVSNRQAFKLQEFLHHSEKSPLKNSKGESFANQLVLSFYKNKN
ncbi:MAG: lantibiotic dehydratase family protein [Salinivirgaceae bacterium]|jgi:hypothetical protein|nr:lantibiotic dehydratase family protein [Salinivirgaceae bacterium]